MDKKIKVLVSNFQPLTKSDSNGFSGFEIDLWEGIAKSVGLDFEYELVPFQQIIPTLAKKKADIGLAGVTITEQRERTIDFSYPTLDSGLRILVSRDRNKIKIFDSIRSFFQEGYKKLLFPLMIVCLFAFVAANLMYLAEMSVNTFSRNYLIGIFESLWYVICSMSTDSFGDYVPHTALGRLVTVGIIVGGVAVFGLLIAEVTAFIAIKRIKGNINNHRDLAGKTVATVKDSTSIRVLQKIGAKVEAVDQVEDALLMVKGGEVDAVVFDAPVLENFVKNENMDKEGLELVGELFARQKYGVAMTTNSLYRENINQALLKVTESGLYAKLYKKWFGETEDDIVV